MNLSIKELFEEVVQAAWRDEQTFSKAVFKKSVKKTDSVCQGLSRLIRYKILGCFPNSYMLEFKVEDKPHIVVYVAHNLHNYIIDGTIKQFLPKEESTVFYLGNYPFKKEIQTAKRRLI